MTNKYINFLGFFDTFIVNKIQIIKQFYLFIDYFFPLVLYIFIFSLHYLIYIFFPNITENISNGKGSIIKEKKTINIYRMEEAFLFIMIKEECICLICGINVLTIRKSGVEGHFNKVRSGFNAMFTLKTEISLV